MYISVSDLSKTVRQKQVRQQTYSGAIGSAIVRQHTFDLEEMPRSGKNSFFCKDRIGRIEADFERCLF
jgi:hypothetical protein